jgi:uncharacterized damage-inducible protein DinB
VHDIIERLEAARRGLVQTVKPFTSRELNYRPGGTASTIRQLLNHLWAAEAWMTERVVRALNGEQDLSREQAEQQLPAVLGVPMTGLLIHSEGLGEVDPSEPVKSILARFDTVRERTRETLSSLGPDDLYRELIDPCDDDRTVRDVLNHMHGHELLHIGAMLNIRGMLEDR